MFVKKISLDNFRNIQRQSLSLNPRINIFTGANGSGKTNLLESIATLCLGRSQRMNSSDSALIQSGQSYFRLNGVVERQERSYELSVACESSSTTRGKKITIDGQPARASELFRTFALVNLSPEDSEIVSGSPSVKRKFLDFHLAQASVTYLANLSRYQRIIAQRNSHLRQYQIGPDGTPFDDELVSVGAKITSFRYEFLIYAQSRAVEYYAKISSGAAFNCHYLPSIILSSTDKKLSALERDRLIELNFDSGLFEEKFRERLESRRELERRRETTLVGPHRDDVEITIRNLPARSHGSQGEWRSAAVALKLAVYDFLRERKEETPILLLDEIFAELDIGRQDALIESFSELGQLIVTTALKAPESIADSARIFSVANGQAEVIQSGV
ncbi:DNA replication and repair protein RecF [bacterium AH-315-J21]|nr:DNA replication and repair protein RecF [bacterium AH-315-J21]